MDELAPAGLAVVACEPSFGLDDGTLRGEFAQSLADAVPLLGRHQHLPGLSRHGLVGETEDAAPGRIGKQEPAVTPEAKQHLGLILDHGLQHAFAQTQALEGKVQLSRLRLEAMDDPAGDGAGEQECQRCKLAGSICSP